ncbi:MAG: hypothetical protein ACUZ8A_06320 [Candidatus Bathyanammoxibius sp.]
MISKILLVCGLSVGLMLLATGSGVSVADEETVTITGTVVCLGCTLKKKEGANAACDVYGHKHGLATSGGKLYSFLENENSEELINSEKYGMKRVEITGKVFENAHIIDVEDVNVIEEKKGGYGKKW